MVVESYLKLNYALRPSKQVERKLLVEAMQKLSHEGLPISDYTSLGFGAPFYADFQVFHRYLFIDKMICVEGGSIPKRMIFNKPFGFIELRLDMLQKSSLRLIARPAIWLLRPTTINHWERIRMADVQQITWVLAPGSVLLVTVEADARLRVEPPEEDMTGDEIRAARAEEINDAIRSHLHEQFTPLDYDQDGLPRAYAAALDERDLGHGQRAW